jgi:hypothetical protein
MSFEEFEVAVVELISPPWLVMSKWRWTDRSVFKYSDLYTDPCLTKGDSINILSVLGLEPLRDPFVDP